MHLFHAIFSTVLMLSGAAFAVTPVAATSCSTPPATSPRCAFVCDADSGVSVAISSKDGGFVQAGAFCPAGESAGCDGRGYCSDTDVPHAGGQGAGSCSGFAEDGDGVLVCSGGDASAAHVLALLQPPGGGCRDAAFRLLGLRFLAVLFVDPDREGDSFAWSPLEGCWPTAHVCERATDSRGVVGTACRLNPYAGTQFSN